MQLYKGIFWIPDVDNIASSNLYFTIPCTSNGDRLYDVDAESLTSRDGTTHNHETLWKSLPRNITHNRPYNHYPRGRVEIRNGKAIIFCSPYILSDELLNWCVDKFNLTKANGIKKIELKADNSEHYRCYLDD